MASSVLCEIMYNLQPSAQVIYNTNIDLVKKLVSSLSRTQSRAHVLMSSSTQEEQDNLYGKSKKEGRQLLEKWANAYNGHFTGLIIPNVFGPFGRPNYNSVVATFCQKLACNETPFVNANSNLQLIFVGELVEEILKAFTSRSRDSTTLTIAHSHECTVANLLELLQTYKQQYQDNGVIPLLSNAFEVNLFNTFRCYINIADHYPVKFVQNLDTRGSFVEVIRLNLGGQVSFSTTVPTQGL